MKPQWLKRLPPRLAAWAVRVGFNWHPAYRRAGGRVVHVAPDLTSMRVRLPLNRRTRNVVGTLFGGSLFAITDGPHPTLLMAALGPDFIVWDKEASIRYRRPGRTTLYADFAVEPGEVDIVRAELARAGETVRNYLVELKDDAGVVHAVVERAVYIADKAHYRNKTTGGETT